MFFILYTFRKIGLDFLWMGLIGETKMAILRELGEGPKHGYSLAEVIEISKGGVYNHLQDLQDAGMVEVKEEHEEGRGKKIYQLTESGELLLEAFDKAEQE